MSTSARAGAPPGDPARPVTAAPDLGAGRVRLSPYLLAYVMGPAALVVILLLEHFKMIAQQPLWLWLAVFVTIPSFSIVLEIWYRRRPCRLRLHARVAWHAATVTAVIYLSGWGPVLVMAFAFIALENVSHDGSKAWRVTALWSVVGITAGQIAIWMGWAPSYLSTAHAEALGLMGAFVLLFVIRMAGATMEQKERAEQSMRTSEERFRSLVQHSSDTTLVVAGDGVITYASPATVTLVGLPPDAVVGMLATDVVHPEDRERVELQFSARLQSDDVTEPVEFRILHADGTTRNAEAILSDLRDQPSVAGFVANLRDVTERKEAQDQLAHQALHDSLTGLANRTLIHDRAAQMLVRAARQQHPVAAFFVDLDNFKEVNDTLGHEAGDEILQAVARRFVVALRATDTVGRLGGDEFVVLSEGMTLAAGPEILAQRIRDVLAEPFLLESHPNTPLTITASIGVASGERETAQDLLRDADIALYRAKATGKDCWALFEPEMQTAVLDRLALKLDLQSAMDAGEFFLLYQPLFELDSMRVFGAEALLRWQHPSRGVVGPDEFIPMLEEMGSIVEVGRWVLEESCRQAASWRARGHAMTMSVNVSMRQLATPALLDHVRSALATSGLPAEALVLEITETDLMRDADSTIAHLSQLKTLGVQVAIDDFGTGYSSLSYLRQFPVDALKIDRSFIASMANSSESAALIHTMVELGRALGLETLAEGIEDRAQLESLRREQCARGQGYLFSRPISAEALERILGGATPAVPHSEPVA